MIYILFLTIVAIVILNLIIFKKDPVAPAVLLSLSFMIATGYASFYNSEWDFSSWIVYQLIVFGVLSFSLGSLIGDKIFIKNQKKITYNVLNVEVLSSRVMILIAIQVVFIFFYLQHVLEYTGISNLFSAIGNYYESNKIEKIELNRILSIYSIFNTSITYLLIYYAVVLKVSNKKNNVLKKLTISIFLGFLYAYLSGTRTEMFMFIIGGLIMFILVNNAMGKKIQFNMTNIKKGSVILVILIFVFNMLSILQGRTIEGMTINEVFSTYLGAPIKNLDLFVSEVIREPKYFGETTFSYTYDIFNLRHNVRELTMYRFIEGKGLGNVYTTFAPMYYDFGVYGTIILMSVLGFICQVVYNNIWRTSNKVKANFRVIIYSFISFSIIFSFFSNKFFEVFISKSLIYFAIGAYISILFLERIRFKK